MTASPRSVQFVGGHEGKVLKAYRDPTGTITIGYGATWNSAFFREWWMARKGHKLRMGDRITEAEALEVLKLLLENEYMPPVQRKFAGQAVNVIEAGTSFTYNAGNGALSWQWAQNIAKGNLKEGTRLWRVTATTSKGQKLPGLVRRRGEEADIAEHNKWPSWMSGTTFNQVPQSHLDKDDILQGQRWLVKLGYEPGEPDGIVGPRTQNATRRYQTDHGQLIVDGVMGRATLNALQRSIEAKEKMIKTAGVGAGTAGAGAVESGSGVGDSVQLPDTLPVQDFGWVGDVLLWGGLFVGILVLVYFAWRYRDELNTLVRKL